jgi:AbiJ-like protein
VARDEVRISEITRRAITDLIATDHIDWWGRGDEVMFLSRLYDLSKLPSTDPRHRDADGDIRQHRFANYDWDDDWVFDDKRFKLRHGPDETFVRFLAEMLHPVVRSDEEEVGRLCENFNRLLRRDGWELVEVDQLSGRAIYAGRKVQGHRTAASALSLDRYVRVDDEEAIREHLRRIDHGLQGDPAAAIGSSKELLETTCKVILDDYGVAYSKRDDVMGSSRRPLRR